MKEELFSKWKKYYHTIKYLKAIQLYSQIKYRVVKPKIKFKTTPLLRTISNKFNAPITKVSQLLSSEKIICLNRVGDLANPACWSDLQQDRLWLYNLHYFDVLTSIPSANTPQWENNLIHRWIDENPPIKGYGWIPYTVSLRIVNWIKWILRDNEGDEKILASLAIQTRFLYRQLEYHLLANHLLANAKALLFSGLFFKNNEASKWFKKGFKLLNQQLHEQILNDGGHFELSPMYHATILEDLLDIINLFQVYQQPVPDEWLTLCDKMFYWLEAMCHADGKISFFNDATFGVAPMLHELTDYRDRLELKNNPHPLPGLTYFAQSGYCRIQHQQILLLIDIAAVGPLYQPAHAHADTFSFELSLDKQRVFVNSGVSTYAEGETRLAQRGTLAHNTLCINQTNSSDVWKSFRVAKRAKVKNIQMTHSVNEYYISASHNGYYQRNKITHTRIWHLLDKKLMIEDQIHGKGEHHLEWVYHLHPTIRAEQCTDGMILLYDEDNNQMMKVVTDFPAKIDNGFYYPGFNISIPNQKIVITTLHQIPINHKTIITIF